VEQLFVAVESHRWGTFDPETGRVEIKEENGPRDDDLLDLAAVRTLLNGGEVHAVRADEVPGRGDAAAVLRF
jgi:hypothetical protein